MTNNPTPTATLPPAPGTRARAWLQDAGLVFVILLLAGFLTGYGYYDAAPGESNTFLNGKNLIDGIATPMSNYAIMAAGMTIVIVAGGIDISVASIQALAALTTAWALKHFAPDTSVALQLPVAVAVALGVGALCGLTNGLLVVGLRMHPFIVTLGTLSIFRGLANVIPFSDEKTLKITGAKLPDGQSLDHPLQQLFNWQLAGLEVLPLLVILVVTAAAYVYLSRSVMGRETYAVGGNEQAARFSGINVNAVKLRAFTINGVLAGLTGLIVLGRYGTATTKMAFGNELQVVAAAVVGGAALAGGRGTAIGALLGTLILAMIEDAINILHFDQELKSVIVGLSIIIAVSLDRLSEAWRAWRAKRGVGRRGFEVASS